MTSFRLISFFLLTVLAVLAIPRSEAAEVTITITSEGTSLQRGAFAYFYKPGKRDFYVAHAPGGGKAKVEDGVWDVRLEFRQDLFKKEVWLEGERFSGTVARTVEIGGGPARSTVVMTNGGVPLRQNAFVYYYRPGKRDLHLGFKPSGQTALVEAGEYDIRLEYKTGAAKKEVWLENQKLAGTFERTVEMGAALARVAVAASNGGRKVVQGAAVFFYKPGKRDLYVARTPAGETATVEAGTYDLRIVFEDGAVKKEVWLENEALSGAVEKTVELGVAIAKATVRATLDGADLGSAAQAIWFDPGERRQWVAWKRTAEALSIEEGIYDLLVRWENGGKKAETWLEGVEVKGVTEKVADLRPAAGEIVVKVVRDGTPVPAWCAAYPPGGGNYVAREEAGTPLRLPEAVYDIGCFVTEDGLTFEGWLKGEKVSGKTERVIAIDGRPASLVVAAPGQAPSSAGGGDGAPNVEIVMDSSGSMVAKIDGKTSRMDAAKDVLAEIVNGLPENGVNVALRVYGTQPKARKDCRDSVLAVKRGPVDKPALLRAVSGLAPSGYTPIAHSLEEAAKDLPPGGNNALVLITDGIESCGGDPCAVAARLAAQGLATRSFVVGFGVGDDKARFLSCIGRYHPAQDKAQLAKALREIMTESLKPVTGTVTVTGTAGTVAARGAIGERLVMPAGTYDVAIRAGGESFLWKGYAVAGHVKAVAGPTPPAR